MPRSTRGIQTSLWGNQNIKSKYFRRVKSNLKGGNNIDSIDTWAVSLYIYKLEKRHIDKKARKMLTIYRAFHPRYIVDRLYLPRKGRGKGLITIDDSIEMTIFGLEDYIMDSTERFPVTARRGKTYAVESTKNCKKRRRFERERQIYGKELHRHHFWEKKI